MKMPTHILPFLSLPTLFNFILTSVKAFAEFNSILFKIRGLVQGSALHRPRFELFQTSAIPYNLPPNAPDTDISAKLTQWSDF